MIHHRRLKTPGQDQKSHISQPHTRGGHQHLLHPSCAQRMYHCWPSSSNQGSFIIPSAPCYTGLDLPLAVCMKSGREFYSKSYLHVLGLNQLRCLMAGLSLSHLSKEGQAPCSCQLQHLEDRNSIPIITKWLPNLQPFHCCPKREKS